MRVTKKVYLSRYKTGLRLKDEFDILNKVDIDNVALDMENLHKFGGSSYRCVIWRICKLRVSGGEMYQMVCYSFLEVGSPVPVSGYQPNIKKVYKMYHDGISGKDIAAFFEM